MFSYKQTVAFEEVTVDLDSRGSPKPINRQNSTIYRTIEDHQNNRKSFNEQLKPGLSKSGRAFSGTFAALKIISCGFEVTSLSWEGGWNNVGTVLIGASAVVDMFVGIAELKAAFNGTNLQPQNMVSTLVL